MTRLNVVSQDLSLDEYRELAEFRHQIRCFQSATEQHAKELRINLDSYILLLAIQGLPEGVRPTVDALSERMCLLRDEIGHLITTAVEHGDITRSSPDTVSTEDWVKLTRSGREALRRMSLANRDELERSGPELVRSLLAVVKQRRRRHRGVA